MHTNMHACKNIQMHAHRNMHAHMRKQSNTCIQMHQHCFLRLKTHQSLEFVGGPNSTCSDSGIFRCKHVCAFLLLSIHEKTVCFSACMRRRAHPWHISGKMYADRGRIGLQLLLVGLPLHLAADQAQQSNATLPPGTRTNTHLLVILIPWVPWPKLVF